MQYFSSAEFHAFTKILFKKSTKRFSPDPNSYPKEWKTTYLKTYDRATQVALPQPLQIEIPFYKLIAERKSHRSSDMDSSINIQDISTILHSSVRELDSDASDGRGRRPVASAGARFPLETYLLITRDIDGVDGGVYHYRPDIHSLEKIYKPNNQTTINLSRLSLDPIADTYPVFFFITAVFNRSTIKYKDRAYRYILLEAGAAGQAIQNASTLLTKRSLIFGGTFDDEVEKLLEIDGVSESLINTVLVK